MYTAEDFEHGCPPRIMGSETELTVALRLPDEEDDYANQKYETSYDYIEKLLSSEVERSGFFMAGNTLRLHNGGIIYDDGGVVESSTPECIGGRQVNLYERIGEQIVQRMVDTADSDIVKSRKVYKRSGYFPVKDRQGNTLLKLGHIGNHENYFSLDTLYDSGILMNYLASRGIWSGSGIVGPDGYMCYQRTPLFHALNVREASLLKRPQRLEFKDGDGNLSDWAVQTKFDMTSLVLRLAEHEIDDDDFGIKGKFSDIVNTLAVNFGTKLGRLQGYMHDFDFIDTRPSATGVQRSIARLALDTFGNDRDIPAEELQAAENVIQACDDIDVFIQDHEAIGVIADRVEWAGKLSWMLNSGLTLDDLTTSRLYAVQQDLQWGDISDLSPGRLWFSRNSEDTITHDEITTAMDTPPKTRAEFRTHLAKQALDSFGYLERFDWDRNELHFSNTLIDPYQSNQTSIPKKVLPQNYS